MSGMRLGIGSYTFGWAVGTDRHRPPGALSATDLVIRAKALGASVVQLCDNLPEETWSPRKLETLGTAAQDAGIDVEIGTRGSDPSHVRAFVEIARLVGSPVLRVVIDQAGDHPAPDEVVRRLREVQPDLERNSVTLAIENHDRFPAKELAGIVTEVGGSVGVCLDTANSFGAAEGPEAVVDTLGPLTVNLHLKDFAVVRLPHMQGFTIEGRALGEGQLNVARVLHRLREMGRRDVTAVVELWTPPEAVESATIEKESAWAERSVRMARTMLDEGESKGS